jgi:muramidase (phage lysozyme)
VDWNNPTQVTEYYNSQVQFLAPLVGGKGEANKIVAQQLLNIAVADGNVDMLAGLEVADRSPTDPGVGRVGDGENAPAFKAAADMIAKEEGIEDQAQTDDVNKLIDRIEVDHLNDLTEAGADPAAIEKANKTRIDRLQSIVETTGNEKANEQLMELKTRPLTYTKNGYDVLLRNHQRTGFIPNDEELGEMEAKGILTGSEARDLQNRRGVDAGSKTVKEMYPSIKGIASKVFVTEIVQKAGFNSVQKLGDFGQNAIETLGEETALHLVDWINRQPPGTVTTPGIRQEASRYAREAIQSRAYQIRTREVPVPGVEGIGKPPQLIFEGPAGDLKSRITVRAPNNRVPASRSEDLRGERPDVVNGFMTRNDVILNDKEIDDSIAALRNGTPLPDRVTAVATASGIPAAEVVRSQENASRGTQTAPAGPDVGNPAASAARPVAPQEASLLNHPNVPQQRVSRSRLRIERLRSIQSERAAEARQAALDREQRLNQGTEGGTGDSVSVLRPFLNLIASGESESSGGYNAVAGSRTGIAGLSQMTFAQARAKAGNNAIGRYQFIPGTMEAAMEKAGLKMSDKFSPENQDKLAAAWILGGQRKALSAYIKGESSNLDAAVDDAGWEWAALEGVKGVGQYDNDGVNKATISSGRVRQTLQQARRSYLDSRSSQQTSNSSTGFRTNATLQKLGGEITYSSEKDANGKVLPGRCTTNVLKTLAANGIPQPYATGNDEGNNPRGAAVQFINSFGWKSLPIPGSRQVKLDSPYGKAVVNQMSLQQYKAAVGRGQIPSGAVVFQTRHSSWNGTNSGSRGYDVAIARSGGSRLFNGTYNGDSIYGAATSHIFVLVPSN